MIKETSSLESNLYYKYVRIIKIQPIQKNANGYEFRKVFVEIDLFKKSGSKRTILFVDYERMHGFDSLQYNDYLMVGIKFIHKHNPKDPINTYSASAYIAKFRIISKERVYSLCDKYEDINGNVFQYETPFMSIVMQYDRSSDIVLNGQKLRTRYVYGDINIVYGKRVRTCFLVAKDMVDEDLLNGVNKGDKILLIYFPVFASWSRIKKDKFGVIRRHFYERKYFHISRVCLLTDEDIEKWTKEEEIDLREERNLLNHPALAKYFKK